MVCSISTLYQQLFSVWLQTSNENTEQCKTSYCPVQNSWDTYFSDKKPCELLTWASFHVPQCYSKSCWWPENCLPSGWIPIRQIFLTRNWLAGLARHLNTEEKCRIYSTVSEKCFLHFVSEPYGWSSRREAVLLLTMPWQFFPSVSIIVTLVSLIRNLCGQGGKWRSKTPHTC